MQMGLMTQVFSLGRRRPQEKKGPAGDRGPSGAPRASDGCYLLSEKLTVRV
jgi:hypothetical protein